MGYPNEVASSLPAKESGFSSALPRWQAITLLLLAAWLYATILTRLFLQWVGPHSDPNFAHGIFVPLFSAFVLWQDRERLKAIPAAPSWAGIPLVVFGLLTLIFGVLGAEIFLQRFSLLILVAGLIILFRGWTFFRAVVFPWAFLVLMIPLPTLIIQQVTFPLQLLASKLATELLQLVGVPVLREGNLIQLAKLPLDVAEACSGIRSLLTLVTLAVIYGYLMETRISVRVLLACCAVPIAVVANSFRIFGTGMLVQFWDPDKAEGFFHTFQGLLIFVVALAMLLAVHRLIALLGKSNPVAHRKAAGKIQQLDSTLAAGRGSAHFWSAALLMLGTAFGLQAHSHNEYVPPRAPLTAMPLQVDGWTGSDVAIDQETRDVLGQGEFLLRDYLNADQTQEVNLYIAYFPTQRSNDTPHSPNHCLPGSGWVPTLKENVRLTRHDGSSFLVNREVVARGGERQLMLYWFQAHGRVIASEYRNKYYLVADAIRMNRSDGAMVRLMTPMLEGESADAAQARILQLWSKMVPVIEQYIPQ